MVLGLAPDSSLLSENLGGKGDDWNNPVSAIHMGRLEFLPLDYLHFKAQTTFVRALFHVSFYLIWLPSLLSGSEKCFQLWNVLFIRPKEVYWFLYLHFNCEMCKMQCAHFCHRGSLSMLQDSWKLYRVRYWASQLLYHLLFLSCLLFTVQI